MFISVACLHTQNKPLKYCCFDFIQLLHYTLLHSRVPHFTGTLKLSLQLLNLAIGVPIYSVLAHTLTSRPLEFCCVREINDKILMWLG